MSEFNPFGPELQAAPAAPDVEEGGSSRRTAVLAGALAALALGAGAFLFLGGGEGDNLEELAAVSRAPRAAAAAVASPAAKLPPVSTKVALGRNPFRALYVQPAAAPAGPSNPGTATAPGSSTTPLGSSVGLPGPARSTGGTGPAPVSGTGSTGTTGTTTPTAKEHKLVLLRVFGAGKDQSAVFSIDGKQQTAKVGSTFGPTAEILLLSIQEGPKDGQWTAVLQVGDSDPFDVIQGEPAYVR